MMTLSLRVGHLLLISFSDWIMTGVSYAKSLNNNAAIFESIFEQYCLLIRLLEIPLPTDITSSDLP